MKIYSCDLCFNLINFEDTECVHCGSTLGYLPVLDNMSSIETEDDIHWLALAPQAKGGYYRKCQNYNEKNICNWMIPESSTDELCLSCNLNEDNPDLGVKGNELYWHSLEVAKRRLVYSLLRLGLPLISKKIDSAYGLSFSFLADELPVKGKETKKVMTGHNKGKITMNIAEADDAKREKLRLEMNERYRTLLGHFRHEIGHYYWYLIVETNKELLEKFRLVFGDERANYSDSLKKHYEKSDSNDWQKEYVSQYASSHPWEDWAESWAHYMHMFDALEMARSWGLTVNVKEGLVRPTVKLEKRVLHFEEMRDQWLYLSSALNSLNRSMGMKDVYPFVWSEAVIEKISFVQQVIINNHD